MGEDVAGSAARAVVAAAARTSAAADAIAKRSVSASQLALDGGAEWVEVEDAVGSRVDFIAFLADPPMAPRRPRVTVRLWVGPV